MQKTKKGDWLALVCDWKGRGGSGFRCGLSTALRTISSCYSALPNTALALPSGWLPTWTQDGFQQHADHTGFLIGTCFCSAFQVKIPRFTLVRVLIDTSFLQHSHLISQKMIGSAFKIYTACNHLSPHPLLPSVPSHQHFIRLIRGIFRLLLLFPLLSQIMSLLRIFQWLPISHEYKQMALQYPVSTWTGFLYSFRPQHPSQPPFLMLGVLRFWSGTLDWLSSLPGTRSFWRATWLTFKSLCQWDLPRMAHWKPKGPQDSLHSKPPYPPYFFLQYCPTHVFINLSALSS